MSGETGYHLRGVTIGAKISGLLSSLGPSTYDEVSPMIEYWIEYALTEQSVDADDLAERLSPLVWIDRNSESDAAVAKFLKAFRDAPHRSEQARSWVDRWCSHVLRWLAAASAENPMPWNGSNAGRIGMWGGGGLVNAASSIGHLIESGVLSHELVRRHLIKPLIAHRYTEGQKVSKSFRAEAIYKLLVTAGDTLLQGLLDPEDVQVCFETLNSEIPFGRVVGLDAGKLQKLREIHTTWLRQREEVPVEVETPIAFSPQDLPVTIGIDIPPSVLPGIELHSVFHDVSASSATSTNDRITAASSPTLSISTVSDLTTTELDDDIGEDDEKWIPTRHETFYLEDGNVEVVCGHTIFRIHSTVVSFSSSKLRDMLSPYTLNAPMLGGCPRVIFKDSADDFAVLLKMVYTPGFPARYKVPEFTTFASLLRIATKYDFPDVREALVEDLKHAYPTKWEDFQAARVLGEDFFGSPKPHTNAVLNLLMEQDIKFALPFAVYRACLGGFPALVSDEPGTVLPRLTLASIVHGMGVMKLVTTGATYDVVYSKGLEVCPNKSCVLNVGAIPTGGRMGALKKIFLAMTEGGAHCVNMLSPLSFGTNVCVNCAKRMEEAHLPIRKEVIWAKLPCLLGWEGWEGV